MDLNRVIRYCQQVIEEEGKKPNPSLERLKSMAEIIEFISSADVPKEDERKQIKDIFQKHHIVSKGTRYVFTKNQDREIDEIIVQIKQEMNENKEQYQGVDAIQFFELFMNNMDDWWKANQFTTWGFNKHFRKILSQILSARISKQSNFGTKKKPSYTSAMNM